MEGGLQLRVFVQLFNFIRLVSILVLMEGGLQQISRCKHQWCRNCVSILVLMEGGLQLHLSPRQPGGF